jgi:hypothetical protein
LVGCRNLRAVEFGCRVPVHEAWFSRVKVAPFKSAASIKAAKR